MPSNIGKGYIWFFSQKKIVAKKKISWFSEEKKKYEELFKFRSFLKAGRSHLSHPHLLSNMKKKKYFAITIEQNQFLKTKKKSKVLFTKEWI